MLLKSKEVINLIPQKPPFVMVDTLLAVGEKSISTSFTPNTHNIFVENGKFTEPGIIENMAQSIALKTGYTHNRKGEKPPIGFIGAIKNLKIYKLPELGETLKTEMHITHEILNITVVKGMVKVNNTLIAEAELRIYLTA